MKEVQAKRKRMLVEVMMKRMMMMENPVINWLG